MSAILSQHAGGVLHANQGEQLVQTGTTLTFKSHAHETGGGALIWEQESPPESMVPPHIHPRERKSP